MLTSLNWLSDHIDLSTRSTEEISDALTFAGIEVEGIAQRGLRSDSLVVAQVLSFVPHPNADKLRLCQVDDGSGTPRQIVCGAKNFNPGDKVPLATPGTVMPGGFEIKESKLRGELSQGMMCSAQELGLGQGHEGLLILPETTPVGRALHEVLDMDTLFTLEITPNRPDCLSHQGVARELAALTGLPLKKGRTPQANGTTQETQRIDLRAPAVCPYYTARTVRGVKVGPSPAWLVKKLESVNLRPINNVVDITNYVLLEMGQPLHAFDLNHLRGDLMVRFASPGERFVALNGTEYTLSDVDLVIADQTQAVALAGVMGGAHSGVTEQTTDVLLESAYFHPSNVRHTSRRLGLISDSSYRFERGVDPGQILAASEMAVALLVEICGGTAEEATQTVGQPPSLTAPLTLDLARTRAALGIDISVEECTRILANLGLEELEEELQFGIPSYRQDLQRPVDLIEEIARIHGIENLPSQRQGSFAAESAADAAYDFALSVKKRLASLGFYESQNIKLISQTQLADALGANPSAAEPVALKNPLSDDHTHLRPSLIPGLLATAGRNLRQMASTLRFYETGTVFAQGKNEAPEEKQHLGIVLGGAATPAAWNHKPGAADFADLRGLIENLVPNTTVKLKPIRKGLERFLLATQIMIDGKCVGMLAQVRPTQVAAMEGRTALYVAEISLELLHKAAQREVRFAELPRFPAVTRDLALAMPTEITASQFDDFFASQQKKSPLLAGVQLFDLYQGEKIAAGTKSMAFRLTYRLAERTLSSAEVDEAHQSIVAALTSALKVTVR